MRRYLTIAVLAAVCAIPGLAEAKGRMIGEFTIRLPRSVEAGTASILVAQYGNGLAIETPRAKKGSGEFPVRIGDAVKSVKILIYVPGYKVVAAEFDAKKLLTARTFISKLQPLPMIPLTVRLTDSKRHAIAGEKVALELYLREMEYFGYADGAINPVTVATGTTSPSGELTARVPAIPDDPYFARGTQLTEYEGFHLTLTERARGDKGYDCVPPAISFRKSYPQPVTVKLVHRGKISGRIAQSFFARHGFERQMEVLPQRHDAAASPVSIGFRKRGERGWGGVSLGADRTFAYSLPPGHYDVIMQARSDGKCQEIILRQDVVVEENADLVIDVE